MHFLMQEDRDVEVLNNRINYKLFYTVEYLIQPNSPEFGPLTQYAVQATTTSNIACYAVLRASHGSSKWAN